MYSPAGTTTMSVRVNTKYCRRLNAGRNRSTRTTRRNGRGADAVRGAGKNDRSETKDRDWDAGQCGHNVSDARNRTYLSQRRHVEAKPRARGGGRRERVVRKNYPAVFLRAVFRRRTITDERTHHDRDSLLRYYRDSRRRVGRGLRLITPTRNALLISDRVSAYQKRRR